MVSLSYLILTAMTLGIACFPNNLFKNYVLELRFIYICKRHYMLLHFFTSNGRYLLLRICPGDRSGCNPYDKEYED